MPSPGAIRASTSRRSRQAAGAGRRGLDAGPRSAWRRSGVALPSGSPAEPQPVQNDEVMVFTEQQMLRYARHIVLPEIGGIGQAQLLEAKVLLVGAGGLGSPLALYLAAAGVGTLGIVDHDRVELSNLHRQIAHPTTQVGMAKTESATIAA